MNDDYAVYLYTLYRTWGGRITSNNKAQVRLAITPREAALQLAIDWEHREDFERHESHLYRVDFKSMSIAEIKIPTLKEEDIQ